MRTLLFIFICCSLYMFACNSNSPKTEANETVQAEVPESLPESFEDFSIRFYNDSMFQISRIEFPLAGEIVEEDLNIAPIEPKDWVMLKVPTSEIDTNEYKVEITRDSIDISERIYIEDSGVDIELKFKRIDSKWYLIYYKSIFI